ncbi:8-oxo-dGTP diphosphatase [Mycoplana sp. BE70]|uniref:NUDIX hydrolase n=1 Tax=Mycoplana sp. BE70 TaxID=2817775 RepID=UPI002860B4D9|nr:NUDIX hydrolase [Mycoplana sp. BE70]MDR6758270.1 8-oxo-dGTP diphosphatase [Mycoplana sp. BE70]
MADNKNDKLHPDVALAVVVDEDRVLVLKRRNDDELSWVFPGGKVAPGETPENAAKRELFEEAGIRCDVSHAIGTRVHPDTKRVVEYFLCVPEDPKPQLREPRLFSDMSWMTVNELEASIDTNLYPPIKTAIACNARKHGKSGLS